MNKNFEEIPSVRIDKWLWAVRFYKTRTLASEACSKGHIEIAGIKAKPSKTVKIGDLIKIKKDGLLLIVKVTNIIDKRVSASIALTCYEKQVDMQNINERYEIPFVIREKGKGRPTKKERREIERLIL